MSPVVATRWMSVGASSQPDAARAGDEAVAAALTGPDPQLLVLFASDAYDLPALVRAAHERGGGTPLIGCSTAGEIASSGPGTAGVVCAAFGGEGFSIRTSIARGAAADLREAGAAAATGAMPPTAPHRVLMLLTDGLAGDQQEVVRGAHGVVGAGVPLVGGCAGDDLKMSRTFQFADGEVVTDAVVAAGIASDAPLGIGIRHGWRPVGVPVIVTASEGTAVHELDGQPALDVYLDRLAAPDEARSDAAAFTRWALTHPLGLVRRAGEPHVRFVGEADFERRSLHCIAEVPRGATAWFMEGDVESVLAATDAACEDAVAALDGRDPLGLLAFDCIARRGVLGDTGVVEEVERINALTGAPVAGFYTYGEIARTRGVSGFHNQTLVVLAVS